MYPYKFANISQTAFAFITITLFLKTGGWEKRRGWNHGWLRPCKVSECSIFVLACVSREIKAKGFIKKSSLQDFISGLFFSMDLSLTGWKKNATTTFSGISTFLDKSSSVLVTLLRLVFISQKGCAWAESEPGRRVGWIWQQGPCLHGAHTIMLAGCHHYKECHVEFITWGLCLSDDEIMRHRWSCNHVIMIKNVVRWNEGPVFNNVAPVLVEFKEEKDRWSIVIIIIIVASDSL